MENGSRERVRASASETACGRAAPFGGGGRRGVGGDVGHAESMAV